MSKPRYPWWSYVKSMVRRYRQPAKTRNEERERDAVRRAVADFSDHPDRLRLISLVFWEQSFNLSGAAQACHVSYDTARLWSAQFLRCVAKHFGVLD